MIPGMFALGEQQFQIFAGEIAHDAIIRGDDGIGKIAFGLLQRQDFFFYRIAGNQPISKDLASLADAMGAIDGLCFNRRVPPGIE